MHYVTETFIRPREISRNTVLLNPALFNGYRRLLCRDSHPQIFVPLRNLQFQAIMTRDEILFIDSFGPYQHDDSHSGRCITISWQFKHLSRRDNITSPAPYDIVQYVRNSDISNNRLVGELGNAIRILEKTHQIYQINRLKVITL